MPWATVIPLIIQYGLPFAETVFKKWTSGSAVTQADFDELTVLASQTPQTHLAAVAAAAGLSMTDPKVVALAALIK